MDEGGVRGGRGGGGRGTIVQFIGDYGDLVENLLVRTNPKTYPLVLKDAIEGAFRDFVGEWRGEEEVVPAFIAYLKDKHHIDVVRLEVDLLLDYDAELLRMVEE